MPIDTCYNSMYWSHNASITLLFQQFNSAEKAVIKYVTVVRIISNPHHIVVRTISNPHHIVVRTISNPHHDVVRISTSYLLYMSYFHICHFDIFSWSIQLSLASRQLWGFELFCEADSGPDESKIDLISDLHIWGTSYTCILYTLKN